MKLDLQKHTFGNPFQIITDRGTAFTSLEFKQYCEEEGIKHSTITTGLPRANGQIERINRTNDRDELREKAKQQILKTQEENRRTYNLRRREPNKYKLNDIVAIKRTQMGPGRKLRAKFLGPYQIEKVKYNDTYDVKRIVPGEGPINTSTCAEFMKPWVFTK